MLTNTENFFGLGSVDSSCPEEVDTLKFAESIEFDV